MVWLTGLRFQSPLFGGAGEGRRREKKGGRKEKWGGEDGEGIKIWENGREGQFARTKLSPLREGIREKRGWGGGKVAGGGEAYRLSIPLLFATDVLHNN